MITDDGLNAIRDVLIGLRTDLKIRYVALGDGATAPANTDHQLVSEKFRKQVTQLANNGTGDNQTICYIAPGECTTFTIQEIGVFASPEATGAANSGVLIARWLYNREKTDLESLQITRDDIFNR